MGLIWDLIQHGQIRDANRKSDTLELRVEQLEQELARTNETLMQLLRALERRFGDDLDGDGRVG
jgi:chaperonin cofactor prefoldin